MKAFGVSLGVTSAVAASVVIAQLVTAQPAKFAAEARTAADVTSTLAGTWTLKQRLNPDGTPYRSRLTGVTYISMKTVTGDTLGPHAVATVHAKEAGVADAHFFNYPADVVGKPFQMESTGTWIVHTMATTAAGTQISARVHTIAKGDLQPYKGGMVLQADIRYNLSRAALRPGAAAVPKLEFTELGPSELTDFAGKKIEQGALVGACCGMTSLVVTGNTMEIAWNNKGKDTWTRTSTSVPAQFR
jgi:hypothetical protein